MACSIKLYRFPLLATFTYYKYTTGFVKGCGKKIFTPILYLGDKYGGNPLILGFVEELAIDKSQ
ncbi:hypothetical protein L8106_08276 [Lyngbya sp. PCC 8106]|nr:hypothetical protein L8106_08276 [Lyngbya sp. PCC 8106]